MTCVLILAVTEALPEPGYAAGAVLGGYGGGHAIDYYVSNQVD